MGNGWGSFSGYKLIFRHLTILQALKNEELKSPGSFNMASAPALKPSTFNAAECGAQPETATVSNLSHQESLDTFPSPELMRTKLMGGSQTLFADALEQVGFSTQHAPCAERQFFFCFFFSAHHL